MSTLYPPISDRDHVLGPPEGPVIVTQFGDFECPLSHEVYVLIRKLADAMPERIRYAYRHFPLTNIHPRAMSAAIAAEAAALQDRFWEMHAALFQHQKHLDDDDLRSYAEAVVPDTPQFERDLNSPAPEERVREDMRFGLRSGVDTTLNLFIGSERYLEAMTLKDIAVAVAQVAA